MTLDDFFTLTEMNSGLTAPSRVRELLAVMQKERDCIVKNASDSTRQRSAVASAIAATENKDCLDIFVLLDGINFISNWLKDSQKFSNNTTDSSLEEFITHLLQALEKLHVDCEKSVASQIWTTVENLLVHNSSKVQDKARVLLESWKTKRDIDASLSDVEKMGALTVDEARDTESSPRNASIPRANSVKDNGHELTRDNQVLSTSSDAVHPDQVESANRILDPPTGDERPLDHGSPASSRQDTLDTHSDFHGPKSKTSESRPFTSSSDAVAEMKGVSELSSHKNTNAGNENPCDESLPYIDSRTIDSDGKSAGDGGTDANQCGSSNAFNAKEGGHINRCILPKSVSSEKSWGNFLSGIRNYMSGDDFEDNYAFGEKQTDRESDRAGKKSDAEIDYGIVDPLEVAMQVAMEVEREIVDYREQNRSPSDKLPESKTQQPDSPDSASGKRSHSSEGPPIEAANESNSSEESATTSSENLDTNDTQDVTTSQVIEAVQEEANTTEKSPCNFFDLNQEVFSEDCDHRPGYKFSAPVSVVSASRATAVALKLPGAPLQFEGNLGWKGSALTSAFRPASPRRMPASNFSTGGSSSSSKQRQGNCCLDIDLNVSESVDESSMETNSRISEHLEFDLNRASEDSNFMGNIDLNDRPSLLTVSFDNSYLCKASRKLNVPGGINIKSDDSAISIMGTRVQVKRNDFVSQTPELAFDYNLGRTGNFIGIESAIPYAHSSVYGYSNIVSGPAMPFSGPMYGPGHCSIPYMVDSRGAPVIPQMMGSASALPTAFSQPPFVINMNGMTHSNGVAPSQSSFDLNSGMLVGSGSKDPAGLGLFLNPSQVRPVDGPSSQATIGSSVGGKREEPDNGYNDQYYPFKHYTPPWKQN